MSYINLVLPYIEQNLTTQLNPEHIAGRYFVSLSQLYRDFYACTGHSVKEYIRKRRISNACEKIKCSGLALSVIAQESGYSTPQAFHKQFKNVVGMTPHEYRQSDAYCYFYPFSQDEVSISVKVSTETIPACQTTLYYDPCLIGIEDRAVASLGRVEGRIFGRNGKQKGNQFCYEVMTETPGPATTNLYATCTVNYTEEEINSGWNYLYNIWLSASMFEEAAGDYFEEYLIQNGQPRRLKLYLPVQKRRAGQHIMIATESEMHFITAQEQGPGAERWASKRLMAFLQERHPLMIRNARRFYVCFDDNLCTCGMECGGSFKLPENSGLQITRTTPGRYALLPYVRLGDLSVGREKINSWLYMNNIAHENTPVFAVYETLDGRYDTESISMRLYKLLRAD